MLSTPAGVALLTRTPRLLVADGFGRADAGALGTSESGHAWTVGNQGDAPTLPTWNIVSQKAKWISGSGTDMHAWVESGAADVIIRANIAISAEAGSVFEGLIFRRLDATNFLAARLNNNVNTLSFFRSLAGVRTQLLVPALPLSDGQVVELKVVALGSRIQVYADGVPKIDTIETNLTTATKHGLYTTGGTATATYDDFKVFGL